MARRWLRDANTNVLTGGVTDNDGLTAASGFNYVSDAAIRTVAGDVLIGPGDTFTGIVYTPRAGLTGAALIESRRHGLMRLLRVWADVPLASWEKSDAQRADGYARKVEADARAVLVDDNLSTEADYQLLLAELSQNPHRWIWRFNHGDWFSNSNAYYDGDVATWEYNTTNGDLDAADTADALNGTRQAGIEITSGDLDPNVEIGKFTT